LTTIEDVRGHEVFKVFVIADDGNGLSSAHQPWLHIMEGVNNGKELLIMDVVVDFGWGKLVGMKGNGVKVTVLVRLLKNT
jgi:hypothetical protein